VKAGFGLLFFRGQVAAMVFNADQPTTDASHNVKFGFEYDAEGNRSKAIYPSGIVKQWQHVLDEDERLVQLLETQAASEALSPTFRDTYYDAEGRTAYELDGNEGRTDFAYDEDDGFRLLSKTWTPGAGSLAAAVAHVYGYDERGRLQSVATAAPGAGPNDPKRLESRTYDVQSGRLAARTTPEGTIHYTYDVHGSPASLASYGERVTYDYDAWGRLARASGGGETWSYAYDDRTDLLTTVTNGVEGTVETRVHDAAIRCRPVRCHRL
jgi:uncharacterized protein RhaS with RHS repeats